MSKIFALYVLIHINKSVLKPVVNTYQPQLWNLIFKKCCKVISQSGCTCMGIILPTYFRSLKEKSFLSYVFMLLGRLAEI